MDDFVKEDDSIDGKFTMDEFKEQHKSMKGMGSMSKMFDMLPGGASAIKKWLPDGFLDAQGEKMKIWRHAIISMTKKEREDADIIINSKRISRISKGSGLKLDEVRSLMKSYKQIKKVLKINKGGKAFKRGPFAKITKQLGMGI